MKTSPDAPIPDWSALETAFEHNAPDHHAYLDLSNGQVVTINDSRPEDEEKRQLISKSTGRFVHLDPASSREQYRWMERFIATVDDLDLRHNLLAAIDGKGAFRRFKDALMGHPVDRERWFTFRSERLRSCMEAWLTTHGITAAERPAWRASNEPPPGWGDIPSSTPHTASEGADHTEPAQQATLSSTLSALSPQETELVHAFAAFLISRRGSRKSGVDASARHDSAASED